MCRDVHTSLGSGLFVFKLPLGCLQAPLEETMLNSLQLVIVAPRLPLSSSNAARQIHIQHSRIMQTKVTQMKHETSTLVLQLTPDQKRTSREREVNTRDKPSKLMWKLSKQRLSTHSLKKRKTHKIQTYKQEMRSHVNINEDSDHKTKSSSWHCVDVFCSRPATCKGRSLQCTAACLHF